MVDRGGAAGFLTAASRLRATEMIRLKNVVRALVKTGGDPDLG
jgi:hypothetical protein